MRDNHIDIIRVQNPGDWAGSLPDVPYHILRWNIEVGNGGRQVEHRFRSQVLQDQCQLAQDEEVLRKSGEGDLQQSAGRFGLLLQHRLQLSLALLRH